MIFGSPMSSNTVKYFSCSYCRAEFTAVKPDYTHIKPNKNKINKMILKHYINVMNVNRIINYIGRNKKRATNF